MVAVFSIEYPESEEDFPEIAPDEPTLDEFLKENNEEE